MRTRCTPRFALLSVLASGVLLLAGCGDDDSSTDDSADTTTTAQTTTEDTATEETTGDADTEAAAQVLELGVEGNELAFDTTELTAKAGTVTLKLNNTSSIQHNIAVEDADGTPVGTAGELVGADATSETTVELEPGTYTFYCEPHKSAGMVGTLVVS